MWMQISVHSEVRMNLLHALGAAAGGGVPNSFQGIAACESAPSTEMKGAAVLGRGVLY